jgi:hypothetical protein
MFLSGFGLPNLLLATWLCVAAALIALLLFAGSKVLGHGGRVAVALCFGRCVHLWVHAHTCTLVACYTAVDGMFTYIVHARCLGGRHQNLLFFSPAPKLWDGHWLDCKCLEK